MASLARIAWRIGQVLVPDDFRALEEALAEEARFCAEIAGMPSYGWITLRWDDKELARGVLRIEKASAALPGGSLFRSDDNLSLPAPLILKNAGTRRVDVHLQVLPPEPRSDEHRARSGPAERLILRSKLSFDEAAPHGRSLLVGCFETRDDRVFQAMEAVVPPLLGLRSTPHLYTPLRRLCERLARYDEDLAKHVAEARRSVGPAQAFQRCRAEVRKTRALLEDAILDQDSPERARLHPFVILRALRELLVEVCLVDGELPREDELPRYDHDSLGPVFGAVMAALGERIDRLPPAAPTWPFREAEGRFVASDIPQHVLDAPELYLIIERPAPYGELPLDKYNVRLGEPGRLPWLSQYSTLGVRPERALGSPSPVDFGARYDVYSLPKPGRTPEEKEEWTHIKKARAIGFLRAREMVGIRASLYWTGSPSAAGGGAPSAPSFPHTQAAR